MSIPPQDAGPSAVVGGSLWVSDDWMILSGLIAYPSEITDRAQECSRESVLVSSGRKEERLGEASRAQDSKRGESVQLT